MVNNEAKVCVYFYDNSSRGRKILREFWGDTKIAALQSYFYHYRKQHYTYRNDGRYTIDNNLAERYIRPLTCERKVSLFYGSHEGADMSVGIMQVGMHICEGLFCEVL